MNNAIDKLKETRKHLFHLLNDVPVDVMNKIPDAISNKHSLDLGYLIALLQGICYLRAAQKPSVDEAFFLPYKPGTKPGKALDGTELNQIKET